MSWGQTLSRAGLHTAVAAAVNSSLAVVINLATSDAHPGWVWVAVGALTVCVFGVSLWAQHSQSSAPSDVGGDFELGKVRAGKNLRFGKIRSHGGFRIHRARSGGDMEFRDIESGRGDASHP